MVDTSERKKLCLAFWFNLADICDKDGVSPLNFTVPVTAYPFFHPRDSPTLSEVLSADAIKAYEYFDASAGSWTITPLPIRIKVDMKVLQFRCRQVTICPDLEFDHARGSLSRKRSLSIAGETASRENSESPKKKVYTVLVDDM